jgi:hypothetical protein
MKALTVLQPFASALCAAVKPVENRTWPPGNQLHIGEWLAIHAGKRWIDYQKEWLRKNWSDAPLLSESFPRGVIIGACRYNGIAGPIEQAQAEEKLGPWAFGPYCWRFDAAVAFHPDKYIVATGRQGLWNLDSGTEALVRALITEEHHGRA